MRPVELAHLTAGLTEPSQDLSIQRHLVDTARLDIRSPEVLDRTGRDAELPGRGLIGRVRIHTAEDRLARVGLETDDETLRILVGSDVQHQRAHHTEHRRVSGDDERKGSDHDQRHQAAPEHGTARQAEILDDADHGTLRMLG